MLYLPGDLEQSTTIVVWNNHKHTLADKTKKYLVNKNVN